MSNTVRCDECEAILEELRAASAEISISPTRRDELRDCGDAFLGMVRGTEEFGDRVDELLEKFRFRAENTGSLGGYLEPRNPRLRDAFRRMMVHRAQTGHTALFRR
jgi:hypothetical protein